MYLEKIADPLLGKFLSKFYKKINLTFTSRMYIMQYLLFITLIINKVNIKLAKF
jgi:hypothetical protein